MAPEVVLPNPCAALRHPADRLVVGGQRGDAIRSTDQSETPLGPIGLWPQSLRTTVSRAMASNFPSHPA